MTTQTVAIASTWRRSFAFLLDWLLVGIMSIVAGIVLGVAELRPTTVTNASGGETTAFVWTLSYGWASILPGILSGFYFAGSWLVWGRTVFQRALGLLVSSADRPAQPSSLQALARWALLSGWMIALGSIELWAPESGLDGLLDLAAFAWIAVLLVSTAVDGRHQGLHDRAAGTVLVRLQQTVAMAVPYPAAGGRRPQA